jgi:hypothetical protein
MFRLWIFGGVLPRVFSIMKNPPSGPWIQGFLVVIFGRTQFFDEKAATAEETISC